MAEAAINRFMPSGYEEDFVVPPDEDFHCIICQLPSKEPVLTRCGHRFCRECLEEYLRRQGQEGYQLMCPTDRKTLERNKDIFPDKLTERKILSLLIKCPSEGCEWNGELRAKENHLASCIFIEVSCTNENCEVKVPRKDLTEHVTTKCQWRIVKCVYCGDHQLQCQIENHLETCEGFLTACPNKCGTRIACEMIPNHVENSCPLTKVTCPYLWIGCNSEIRREELEAHLHCETRNHLKLACRKLKRVEVLEDKLEERVKVLEDKLDERDNIQIGEINERRNQNNNFAVAFVIVVVFFGIAYQVVQSHSGTKMEIHSQLEKEVGEVHTKLQTLLDKKVDDLQKKMDALNTELGNKIMLLNAAQPYTFTWKIKNFENVLILAKGGRQVRIESEPFLMYGYKFKLQLCPNGNGDGQNTHLSLFLIVMKGEYDAILAWPFQQKLMFTLIDQQENPAERRNVISVFTPKPTHVEYFAKPIASENNGLGCHKFASHKELWTRRFVVDDVIFIEIQVGPPS